MESSFEVVHNIPSPYRLHLFGALHRALSRRGVGFHVHFMATGHRDRPQWAKPDDLPFGHTYWRDWGVPWRGHQCHLNPGLVGALRKRRPAYLYVCGPFDTPTGLLVSALARARCRIAALEPNTRTPGRLGGAVGAVKRWALLRYDYVKVPGREGARWLDLALLGQGPRPVAVRLPNLVDEHRFIPRSAMLPEERDRVRGRLGIANGLRLALWPARLIPMKGVVEFLSVLDARWLAGWHVLILGEGPLQSDVGDAISTLGLVHHVSMRPYIPYDEMPALYGSADLFVLPSLRDPCPLSVVEATHAGLPLLLSDRVGNYPEALEPGVNGWGFDPASRDSVRGAAEAAFGASETQLEAMGRASHARALEEWTTETCVERFLDAVGV